MILGISSFTYGWSVGLEGYQPEKPMDEVELLEVALRSGLKCIQVGDNLSMHLIGHDRMETFRNALKKNNTRLEIGARGLTEEHLKTYIDLSIYFGAPLLRFVIDGAGYTPELSTVAHLLKNADSEFKKHGITLGIENHDRFRAREFAWIIEAVGSDNVGICLDCVNSMGAGEGLEQVADILAPYTVNLHIKDFAVIRLHHKMGFTITGAPVGQGLLDLDYLMGKISGTGRCQSAILEQWVPPEEDLEDSIKEERAWAKKGIEYLKKLKYFTA
jgi:3-oxoisoapionate decarboxylase